MKFFFIYLFSMLCLVSSAQAATGYIDTSVTNNAKVCHDSTCATPTPGIINFELSQESSIVIDDVTGVTGNIWGNELGWINLNPTGQGISFSSISSGTLTGKAWSQVSGWINLNPTGQGVTINPSTGEFSGWAWTGGPYGGWIKFDCNDSSTCVKTSWRNTTNGGGGGSGGGGGGGHPIDVCSNIDGIQTSIPNGYSIDIYGKCTQVIDVCPNLIGEQISLPKGFTFDEIGACISVVIDYCPNIIGTQYTIPEKLILNSQGNCVTPKEDFCPEDLGIQKSYMECKAKIIDVCPNIPGVQESLPLGYALTQKICLPEIFDICPNIPDNQYTVPSGYKIDETGSCAVLPKDICNNLGGIQVVVPTGYTKKGDNCFFIEAIEDDFKMFDNDGVRVVAFSFVPSVTRVESDNPIIKLVLHGADKVFGTEMTNVTPYKVDLVSVGIGASAIGLILIILSILVGFIKKILS